TRPHLRVNLAVHLSRHAVLTPIPLPAALAWHLSLQAAFLPASRNLTDVHALGGPDSCSVVSRLPSSMSTLPSIMPRSLVVAQPPFDSILAQVALNLLSAFVMQSVLTAVPLLTALASHLVLPAIFFPAALIFSAAHFCPGVDAIVVSAELRRIAFRAIALPIFRISDRAR